MRIVAIILAAIFAVGCGGGVSKRTNNNAAEFYRARGVEDMTPAYELDAPHRATLMFCRHCLRYAMGWCPHRGGRLSPYREPYTLVSADGKRFALTFDCKQCVMMVKEK